MGRKNLANLHKIAIAQSGVFTAKQAVDAGFDARNHHYQVKAGYWEKEHRGIYRLAQWPFEPPAQYVLWSLWSCNRKGEHQGVYSHETALSIYDLTDLNPVKLHMTVPLGFRKAVRSTPKVLVLHREKLVSKDWRDFGSYKVTTPTRTLYDIISSNRISEEFVAQAVNEGLSRGLYPKEELARYGIIKKVNSYRKQQHAWW